MRFYERAMETVESVTTHEVDTAHKVAHEERQAVHTAKK